MILSKLEPKNIQYKSGYGIDSDDIDYDTSVYDYVWNGINIEIALGKIKYTYSKYGVLYCSIYLIDDDTPVSRIGIFEISDSKILTSINDDAMDMKDGNILIFATEKYIKRMLPTQEKKAPITITETDAHDILELNISKLEKDDVMTLAIDDTQISNGTTKAVDVIGKDIFTLDTNVVSPALLQEESQIDSDEINDDYKEAPKSNWIEKFARNNNYSILENEGKGDCLFAVIRDAYRQIGKQTTVKKLRALLAKEVNDNIFKEYKSLYDGFSSQYQTIDVEMKAIEKLNREMKRRIVKITDKVEHGKILKDATELAERYKQLKRHRIVTKTMLNEFLFMENQTTSSLEPWIILKLNLLGITKRIHCCT